MKTFIVQHYNGDTDVNEKHCVSASRPEVVYKLLTKLEIWLEKRNVPMPNKRFVVTIEKN